MLKCIPYAYVWWITVSISFACEDLINSAALADTHSHLDVDFVANIVNNEYIVKFHKYYGQATREKFLKAALLRTNIYSWEVISRDNPAAVLPSDFDLLRLTVDVPDKELLKLELHPAIKRVTNHYSVQRQLSYICHNNSLETRKLLGAAGRKLLRSVPVDLATHLRANVLWKLGITGLGVKIAVFDTGLANDHPHFRRVKERTNWTNEKSLDDNVSHGTFVAGIIASSKECRGIAPDAELHIYRVFTNNQVSYTSWFLDAFNYAIYRKVNILNLSIGGPDFLDYPFVEKVLELSANKVLMVSAIGNDGPLYGTLNNPADQSDVIGVGGINFDENVAKFSSRGMTTWELPAGYGRLKPDIVTYGSHVKGSNVRRGCRSLSGTSVASPVVAGAIALIASGALDKLDVINPASMKQILIESANRLPDNNMFEQGHGKLDILNSMRLLSAYTPKVTLSPAYLDFTENYMWPYSSQPIFCGCTPVVVNVTILNGVSVTGNIVSQPIWKSYSKTHGSHLNVAITYSPVLWPWSGWMAVYLGVNDGACRFEGVVRGHITVVVESLSSYGQMATIRSTVNFPITVKIIPKPPRHKRILWDQFHNLKYPPAYIPRDNLKTKSDPLDWRGDHIHTNFRDVYNHLRNSGYYVDVLREPFTCFNATNYGTLLIIDPEEEFFNEEITKLKHDVYTRGLSIIVFADWYNTTVMNKIKFFDENTRQWWIPETGGTNIPALNDLLQSFDIVLSDFIAEGYYKLGDHDMYYASGATIAKFPNHADNIIVGAELNDQGVEIVLNSAGNKKSHFVPILGLMQTTQELKVIHLKSNSDKATLSYEENSNNKWDLKAENSWTDSEKVNKRVLLNTDFNGEAKEAINAIAEHNTQSVSSKRTDIGTFDYKGRISIFGDSNCLDSTHLEKACFWLLDTLLEYTMNSHKSDLLQSLNRAADFKFMQNITSPLRLVTNKLHMYSKVLNARDRTQKLPASQCENLMWTKPVIITEKQLEITVSSVRPNTNGDDWAKIDIEKNLKISRQQINDLRQADALLYKTDESNWDIFILLTVCMTAILLWFIKHLRRRRLLSSFIL